MQPKTQPVQIQGFYDEETQTMTYVVFDSTTEDAVIIDPVMDYDPASSQTSTDSIEEVLLFIKQKQLKVHAILETHAHADHLSGSQLLAKALQANVVIGKRITEVQKIFKTVFNLPNHFHTDGSQFDRLLDDGEILEVGSLQIKTINTPGHTPACVTYHIGDAIFTGDALFMHDYGTGRCDFPGGSAEDLYQSIHEKLYQLPDATRVFVGHVYGDKERPVRCESTIALQKQHNPHIRAETTRDEFVAMRNQRDATLRSPRLLFQSVQVNIDAGHLPGPSDNQVRYLRIPINAFRGAEQSGIQNPDTITLEERELSSCS